MDNNHSSAPDQPRMSRSQYRQQQKATDQQETSLEDAAPVFQEEMSRQATADERHEQTAAEKTATLKRRLNIAIIVLIIAIIIVYLILFYVG